MDYNQRFTQRVCLPDEEIDENVTYLPRVADKKENIILNRLGLYEDLGFAPAELAEILLNTQELNADEMERIKIALIRIKVFMKKATIEGVPLESFEG